eukprot:232233-Rhodomonas_salina.2
MDFTLSLFLPHGFDLFSLSSCSSTVFLLRVHFSRRLSRCISQAVLLFLSLSHWLSATLPLILPPAPLLSTALSCPPSEYHSLSPALANRNWFLPRLLHTVTFVHVHSRDVRFHHEVPQKMTLNMDSFYQFIAKLFPLDKCTP